MSAENKSLDYIYQKKAQDYWVSPAFYGSPPNICLTKSPALKPQLPAVPPEIRWPLPSRRSSFNISSLQTGKCIYITFSCHSSSCRAVVKLSLKKIADLEGGYYRFSHISIDIVYEVCLCTYSYDVCVLFVVSCDLLKDLSHPNSSACVIFVETQHSKLHTLLVPAWGNCMRCWKIHYACSELVFVSFLPRHKIS